MHESWTFEVVQELSWLHTQYKNNANTELHVWITHIYYAQQSNFACMYKLLNIREHTYYTTVVIYVGN